MIATDKRSQVAALSAANLIASMPATVQERLDRSIGLPHHEDAVLAHESGNEVPRLRNLAFVGQKQPAAAEDFFKLKLIDFFGRKNLSLLNPRSRIDENLRIAHDLSLPKQISLFRRLAGLA
jgi:hypothetical protein